jgi:hypothetical protein
MSWSWRFAILALLALTTSARAQETEAPAPEPKPFRFGGEIKFNFRHSTAVDSDEYGEETVSAGHSLELQNVALKGEGDLVSGVSAKFDIHLLDLYNRNPTTADDRVFVREAWITFHSDGDTPREDEESRFFVLIGQAPRFSKQRFRRLESYGLWGTAVGRFEERQVQAGGAIGGHAYWRASVASANALFLRDPNALAGDNGINPQSDHVNAALHTGFPILYDAKASDLNFTKPAQWGIGGGARWVTQAHERDDDGSSGSAGNGQVAQANTTTDSRVDVLGWYFRRKLDDTTPIRGSQLPGDLALLFGSALPVVAGDTDKIEWGANLEVARGGLRLFAQGVHQSIAGLVRRGYEIEAAYVIDTHGLFLLGESPALNWIQPVVRISSIDNRFALPDADEERVPLASLAWNWRKYDLGVRIGIVRNIDLTAEFNRNTIIVEPGETLHPDEALITLRIGF